MSMPVDRSIFSNAFPPWYADRQAPAFPDACGKARSLRIWSAYQRLTVRTQGASLVRILRLATCTSGRTKPVASPGPLLPSIP